MARCMGEIRVPFGGNRDADDESVIECFFLFDGGYRLDVNDRVNDRGRSIGTCSFEVKLAHK